MFEDKYEIDEGDSHSDIFVELLNIEEDLDSDTVTPVQYYQTNQLIREIVEVDVGIYDGLNGYNYIFQGDLFDNDFQYNNDDIETIKLNRTDDNQVKCIFPYNFLNFIQSCSSDELINEDFRALESPISASDFDFSKYLIWVFLKSISSSNFDT